MYKVVIVGCGAVSGAWLHELKVMKDVQIVGMVDLDPEAINRRKKEFGLTPQATGPDLSAVIKKVGADVVFDCTVPKAHPLVVETSLGLGCHVLGEKPMAESMKDALKMTQMASNSGKTYAVIQNRRYTPQIIRYRDTIASGEIGPITTLNADFYVGAHFEGFRNEMKHVLLVDMAIHSFDQARFISGKDPVSVYCHEWNPSGSGYKHGASAVAIFEMSDGVVFTYRGSWCAEGKNTSWECDWRCVGEKGTLLWDGEENVTGEVIDQSKDPASFMPWKQAVIGGEQVLTHHGHAGVIREFLDSLKGGMSPQTTCSDNIKSVAMVHAAVESAETGRKVDIVYN